MTVQPAIHPLAIMRAEAVSRALFGDASQVSHAYAPFAVVFDLGRETTYFVSASRGIERVYQGAKSGERRAYKSSNFALRRASISARLCSWSAE